MLHLLNKVFANQLKENTLEPKFQLGCTILHWGIWLLKELSEPYSYKFPWPEDWQFQKWGIVIINVLSLYFGLISENLYSFPKFSWECPFRITYIRSLVLFIGHADWNHSNDITTIKHNVCNTLYKGRSLFILADPQPHIQIYLTAICVAISIFNLIWAGNKSQLVYNTVNISCLQTIANIIVVTLVSSVLIRPLVGGTVPHCFAV